MGFISTVTANVKVGYFGEITSSFQKLVANFNVNRYYLSFQFESHP